jgi:hypothetical protein
MHFQEIRNIIIEQYNWDYRLATLAIRIAKGIEDFNDIARTPNFSGRPLLSTKEKIQIKQVLCDIRQLCKLPAVNGRRD